MTTASTETSLRREDRPANTSVSTTNRSKTNSLLRKELFVRRKRLRKPVARSSSDRKQLLTGRSPNDLVSNKRKVVYASHRGAQER